MKNDNEFKINNKMQNVNIKQIYRKIQDQLLYMIPEKWNKIYLYASVTQKLGNLETGEMFFYYFPKGILKKNPVNGYEIPIKFNLEEEKYLTLITDLYNSIKCLKAEFRKQGKKLWNSLTIKMENMKFEVEFHYDELPIVQEEIEAKHILWVYKNLNIPVESFNKKQRQLLQKEIENKQKMLEDITTYSETVYRNPIKNVVQYHKEEVEFISDTELKEDFNTKQEKYIIKTQILNAIV